MSGHLQLLRQGLSCACAEGELARLLWAQRSKRVYQPLWETQIGREKEGKEGSGEGGGKTGPQSVPGLMKRMQKTDEKDEGQEKNGEGGKHPEWMKPLPSLISVQRKK